MGCADQKCRCGDSNELVSLQLKNPISVGGDKSVGSENAPTSERSIIGSIQTPAGNIPQISAHLDRKDYFGAFRVRWGMRRDQYRVNPGLYAVGTPNERSDVFVTANYKLTFDTVRKNLAGLNAWLLVLDTKGINVWCAAGKGTFGTDELVRRIRLSLLEKIVAHRRLILPQLGATGVAAHLVKKESGFTVLFGPIRASDIRLFINASYKVTKEMRQVNFGWYDRLILTPNDFVYGFRYLLAVVIVYIILSGVNRSGISFQMAAGNAFAATVNIALSYFAGIVLTPLLLPYIPIRMFAFKGYIVGLVLSIVLALNSMLGVTIPGMLSWFLLLPAISSFMAMNFTGSSTFTSLSGVKKEMRVAVPFQIASVVLAAILMITNNLA
jgi:CO dehydrogenase/acetyl-CoA synthase delta subunit